MWTIFRSDGSAVDTADSYADAKYRAERLTDQQPDSRVWFFIRPTCPKCGAHDGNNAITNACVRCGA